MQQPTCVPLLPSPSLEFRARHIFLSIRLRDPDRLLNKKKNMAAQLLKEEKTRNAIKKDLPKIEAKIKHFCAEWEQQHGTPFMLEGVRLSSLLGEASKSRSAVQGATSIAKRGDADRGMGGFGKAILFWRSPRLLHCAVPAANKHVTPKACHWECYSCGARGAQFG